MNLTLYSVQKKRSIWTNLSDRTRKIFAIAGQVKTYERFKSQFRDELSFSEEYDMRTVRIEGYVGAESSSLFQGSLLDISGNLEASDIDDSELRFREKTKLEKVFGKEIFR